MFEPVYLYWGLGVKGVVHSHFEVSERRSLFIIFTSRVVVGTVTVGGRDEGDVSVLSKFSCNI